jgi:hypothetical protein
MIDPGSKDFKAMSVSSVSTSVPPQPVAAANQNPPNPPDNNNDNNSDAVGAAQSASQGQAPLPPGQGTRIDQLV